MLLKLTGFSDHWSVRFHSDFNLHQNWTSSECARSHQIKTKELLQLILLRYTFMQTQELFYSKSALCDAKCFTVAFHVTDFIQNLKELVFSHLRPLISTSGPSNLKMFNCNTIEWPFLHEHIFLPTVALDVKLLIYKYYIICEVSFLEPICCI